MDDRELNKLTCSRHGHKGHLTKLISGTEEILGRLSSARETDPDAKLLDSILLFWLTTAANLATTNAVTRASRPPSLPLQDGPPVQQRPETHVSDADTNTHRPAAETIHTDHSGRVTPLPDNTESRTIRNEPPHHTYHFSARQPKLEIPVFCGEPLDWQPFWDCFQAAIDTNPTLTGVQKLSYLRAQLRGEALRMITGLPLTNANYQTSVTLLKDHNAQSQCIISAHIQALLDLPKPSNKLTSLRLFFNTIETHVCCLASLGKSPDSLDTLLAPMILTKLPDDTKRNIARNHTATEWTVSELQAAISNEMRIFETGQHFPPSSSQSANPTASFNTVLQRRPYSKK